MTDISANILTETLDEVYDKVDMQGSYDGLKTMISSILADCECAVPTVDIQVQLEGMIADIGRLKDDLIAAVAAKMESTPKFS